MRFRDIRMSLADDRYDSVYEDACMRLYENIKISCIIKHNMCIDTIRECIIRFH